MSNLSFAGGSFSATYTVPVSHIGYGVWQYPSAFNERIRAQDFSQMVDASVISVPMVSSVVVVWNGNASVSEVGLCAINGDRTGWSALFTGLNVFIRNEVAGSPGSITTAAVPHGMVDGNEYTISASWDNTTGAISVYVDGILVTTGNYTLTLTGLRAGMQQYNADNSPAVKSLSVEPVAAGPAIDTITSPVTHGQTGLTLTTSLLGTITSMTVDGVAVASVSATGGDGTWVAKSRVDGATLPGYGSKAVVVGDGTDTASSSVTVNPPSTQSFVTLTSVNTSPGYLGAYRTLNIGDQIAFDTAATLEVDENYIDVDGGIYTDYAGTQTIWHWVASTKVTTQITLINGVVADSTPDAFSFTAVTNAPISVPYTSNTITVSGIAVASPISITGGTYSKNGGAYTSAEGTVLNGDTVTVKTTSSGSSSTAVNAVVTIGGVSGTYTVTTAKLFAVTVNNYNFNNSISNGSVAYSAVLRWPMIIGSGDVNGIVLSDMGWYHNDNDKTNIVNAITVTSAVLENGTTFTPITKGASRTWVISPGDNDSRCDTITPAMLGQTSFTRGQVLWWKARVTWSAASQQTPYSSTTTASVTGSQAWYADPTATTFSTTDAVGPFTSSGTAPIVRTYGYCPIALGTFVSPSTNNVWFATGDSSIVGSADTTSLVAGGVGLFQRALWDSGANSRVLAGLNFSRSGATVLSVTGATDDVIAYWAQFASYGVDSNGFATFSTSGTATVAATALTQMQGLWTKYRARGLTKIIKLKQPPYTSSTDGWATEDNQTVPAGWASGGNVDIYHGLVAGRVGTDIEANLPTLGWRGVDPFKYVANGTANGITPKTAPSIAVATELRTSMDEQAGIVSDSTPDAFTFVDVTGAAISTVTTSNGITVAGIDTTSAISVTGGTYSINGGAYTSSAGFVVAGDVVTVRVTSSASFLTAVNAVVTIGGVSDTYTVTTQAADTTPDAFVFTDVTGATQSTVYTSNTITVSGINSSTAITVTGGTYSKNGGGYTSSAGTVVAGDTVATRITSSSADATAVSSVVTIGGVSDTYTVSTGTPADTTPDVFTFVDVTNATINTPYTSNTITVSGVDSASPISVTGGQYSKNGGAFTSTPDTVVNGDTVATRITSSGSFTTAVNSVVTIGGGSDTFTVTTEAVDTTPDAFSFADLYNAALSTVSTSDTITVTGINSAANISVVGGTYSKNGGSYTSSPGTVVNGDTVTTRITSSAFNLTTVNSVVTIGGVSDTYSVTTIPVYVPGNNRIKRLGIGIRIGI